jgi:hypothetical protein
MSKKLTKTIQKQIVEDLIVGMETMEEEEFDGLYNQLDAGYQIKVDEATEKFACGACGNPAYPMCKVSCPLHDD